MTKAKGTCHKYKKTKHPKMLIEHMAKGLSIEAFAGKLNVSRQLVYQWKDKYPEFKEAWEIGKGRQALFFEQMGISAMAGKIKNFNASTYIFTMKNKLGWKDKVEVENQGSISIVIDDDDQDL